MKVFHNLRCSLQYLVFIMCSKLHVILLYKTRQGVKNYNVFRVSDHGRITNQTIYLDASDLFLGADLLRDEYTLLDVNLLDSPHVRFVKTIDENGDLGKSDYILRYQKGTLDERRPQKIEKNYDSYTSKFLKSKQEVLSGNYSPVIVYQVDDRYYLYDGKHRAAMCALVGQKVKCIVIESSNCFLYHRKYMFEIIRNDNAYSKQNEFYKKFLKQYNNERE